MYLTKAILKIIHCLGFKRKRSNSGKVREILIKRCRERARVVRKLFILPKKPETIDPIIGKKIMFNAVLLEGDSVYITYIVAS